MFASDTLGVKAAIHIRDKFKVYMNTNVYFDNDVMSIEIFDKLFEVCSMTIEEFMSAGRSVVMKMNKWIRENFDRVQEHSESPELEEVYFENEEPKPACRCLEKTGTIYNHPELRAFQKHYQKYSLSYNTLILGMSEEPGSCKDGIDIPLLKSHRRQCNVWAHPDKGGDSELFDMVTFAYEELAAFVTEHGGKI